MSVYSGLDIAIIRYCGNVIQITQNNTKYFMYQIQDSLKLLHVRLRNLFARGNHLYIHILSLKGEIWAHKTRLPPPFFIEVHVASQGACIFVLESLCCLCLQFFC